MPRCLLVNPVVNHNILANFLLRWGVECFAFIDMEKVGKLSTDMKNRERDFDRSLYTEIYLSLDELPDPASQPFDAVMAGGEIGVEEADQICAGYQLPGNDPETTRFRRNKEAMQKQLSAAGLPHIKTIGISKGDDLRSIVERIPEGPYILKPVDAAGGEGLRFCRNFEELENAIQLVDWGAFNCTWRHNERFLVQEYISGTEYVVDLVARNGELVVSAISRYVRLCDMGYWSAPNVKRFLVLENPSHPKFHHLIELAKQCCKALGIRQGAAHMEFLDGPKGLRMVEVGARLHGSLVPSLYSECYENDLLSSLYVAYFDKTAPLLEGNLKKYGLRSFVVANESGTLTALDPIENAWLQQCGSLFETSTSCLAGEDYPKTSDEVNTPASGFLVNDNFDQLLSDTCIHDQIWGKHFNSIPYEKADLARWLVPR
ncbi:acetyl-CoA carboxylase biotin carboxylase subunit family protein [Mesorhizobium sp. NPDC059025]|uniref:ATP-grasp domain-containing protein n=1 Tax=unclassified Mesorhizobium TaxID=325217 RepID=UPI0036ACB797